MQEKEKKIIAIFCDLLSDSNTAISSVAIERLNELRKVDTIIIYEYIFS